MFTIFLQKQADIWHDLLEFYFPNGASIIDYTYGTGATWWNTSASKYKITKTDAEPMDKSVIKKDLTADSYLDLGLHDAGFFDPPYLIGRQSFDYPLNYGAHRQGLQGKRSWGSKGLDKYVSNVTLEVFNKRVEGLNNAAAQTIKKDGLLFVKIMDCRKNGRLISHHINIAELLTNFELVDLAIYLRMGATTFESKNHLQNLHGYWMVFKKS